MKQRIARLGVVLTAALALSGCATSTPAPDASADVVAVTGGDMTIAWLAGGASLDNALMNGTSIIDAAPLSLIYGQLVYSTTDGDIEPLLAKSLTVDDGGDTWELTLREGLSFSDGTPLDAAAVVANYDRFSDPEVSSAKARVLDGITYTAVDDRTVALELPAPNRAFDQQFALHLSFLGSPTAFEADPEQFRNNPVGAGPYMVDTWIQGDSLVLAPNPEYPEDRAPKLDSLTIKVISDQSQAFNSVQSGAVDMAFTNVPDTLADAEAADLAVSNFFPGGGGMLFFGLNSAPFDDIRARQAVTYAIDTDAIMNSAFGAGNGATGFWAEDSPWRDAGSVLPKQDAEDAQRLLDELAAEGKPLSFTITTNETQRTIVESVQAQLLEFDNIDVQVSVLDNPTHTTRLRAGDYELVQAGWAWATPYPGYVDVFSTAGATNYSKYSNPVVDDAAAALLNAETNEERAELYGTIEAELLKDFEFILEYHWNMTFYATDDVAGVEQTGSGTTLLWDQLGFIE